jgi:hypothetical protein
MIDGPLETEKDILKKVLKTRGATLVIGVELRN